MDNGRPNKVEDSGVRPELSQGASEPPKIPLAAPGPAPTTTTTPNIPPVASATEAIPTSAPLSVAPKEVEVKKPTPVPSATNEAQTIPVASQTLPQDRNQVPRELTFLHAGQSLQTEIQQSLEGKSGKEGVAKDSLVSLCRVIDYWLADDTKDLIAGLGLARLADEIKKDYVLASFLAWRGEYKLSYITLRSFLESFCLLLYYINQGCDRLLYLKGRGYKLMLHRMAQKRPEPDDMHAFRRHYHLLIEEGYGNSTAADKFFEEIGTCYSLLSKAVHGDYSPKPGSTPQTSFYDLLQRVLRVCNTLALHDPMLDATEDDLEKEMDGIFKPVIFEWRGK